MTEVRGATAFIQKNTLLFLLCQIQVSMHYSYLTYYIMCYNWDKETKRKKFIHVKLTRYLERSKKKTKKQPRTALSQRHYIIIISKSYNKIQIEMEKKLNIRTCYMVYLAKHRVDNWYEIGGLSEFNESKDSFKLLKTDNSSSSTHETHYSCMW